MLLPVLPADVHPLILEQLVEPISVDRFPPHYKHPRAASLVCKDWAKTAQKLLYEHVYLVVEEDRVSNFHAGKPMTDWTIQDLALQAADPEGIDLNHEYLIDSVVDIVGREALPSLKLVDIFAVPLLLPLAANLTTLQLPLYRHKPPLTDLAFHLRKPEEGWNSELQDEVSQVRSACEKHGFRLEVEDLEE
ncbi:hypothetical protein JCM10213_009098 [Rhodosporidiobolus nylandii]